MKLIPNGRWDNGDENTLPEVVVHILKDHHFLHVRFQVTEPDECYAATVDHDGGHAWEDSCVEIFVKALDSANEYINFEFTSKGFCYAARGLNREHRKEFLQTQYSHILRSKTEPVFENGKVTWELRVSIPGFLLGSRNLSIEEIHGNIYKCGDKTRRPHYLVYFPVSTEKPDFHQPRFFKKLI